MNGLLRSASEIGIVVVTVALVLVNLSRTVCVFDSARNVGLRVAAAHDERNRRNDNRSETHFVSPFEKRI